MEQIEISEPLKEHLVFLKVKKRNQMLLYTSTKRNFLFQFATKGTLCSEVRDICRFRVAKMFLCVHSNFVPKPIKETKKQNRAEHLLHEKPNRTRFLLLNSQICKCQGVKNDPPILRMKI